MLAALLIPTAAGQYVGSATCGKCHPKQYSEQSKSGHARALSPARDHTLALRFGDGVGEWAFGAGDQAVTFVSRAGEESYIEHGLSYYTRSGSMSLTPGHHSTAGVQYRTFDPGAAILRCFQCHSTGPPRMTTAGITPFEAGVRCETCHGPGEAHASGGGHIVNPKQMTAARINEFCGACHRKTSAEELTNWGDPWNARHQPMYLARSRCFLESGGKLTCFTCHPPHSPVSRKPEDYSERCRSCHAAARHKHPVSTQEFCTPCHMPAVVIDKNLRFANHWIGVFPAGQTLRPAR